MALASTLAILVFKDTGTDFAGEEVLVDCVILASPFKVAFFKNATLNYVFAR
jgi:hypothetical protein